MKTYHLCINGIQIQVSTAFEGYTAWWPYTHKHNHVSVLLTTLLEKFQNSKSFLKKKELVNESTFKSSYVLPVIYFIFSHTL
jgi:hypothetical protein